MFGVGGVVIENVEIRGRFTNEKQFAKGYGIQMLNDDVPDNPSPAYTRICEVRVHGFHEGGIQITGGWRDVEATDSEVLDIGEEGISDWLLLDRLAQCEVCHQRAVIGG